MNKPEEEYDVIVVGGGASGLMAAGRAAEAGKRVLLLEKNHKLGEKLSISGGGRCNILNAEENVRELLSHYGSGEQFLYSAFAQFGMKETYAFFESHGLPLIVEARKRAFPASQLATDVTATLERYARENGVRIRLGSPVKEVRTTGDKNAPTISLVVAGGVEYRARSFIFATGGLSHPETGSTGDGFRWLERLGHTIEKPTPGIVPLATRELWSKEISGVSLSFMKITFFVDGKKAFAKTGKILFTHFGISGPLILNSAARVGKLLHEGEVTATIDAYPDTDLGSLERSLIATFDKNKNKMLKNIMDDIVPHGTIKGLLPMIAEFVHPDTKVHSVTKEDRKKIVRLLKALPLTVVGLMGFDRAVVADGGVPLSEIDTRTMRSKKVSNLFLTGDLLNINRPSGGYSLQLCWTTGWVSGTNA